MKTLSHFLNESCKPYNGLNEAFSSPIIATLHKNNSEVMNQFFRSLVKYRYSINGLKDDFITRTDIATALKKRTNDVVKIWMVGPNIAAITVGNALVDATFNWTSKGQGSRNNESLIGNKEHISNWLSKGDSYAKEMFTACYMIVVSSLKALGEKKEPTEIVTKEEVIMTYKPNLVVVPKMESKKKPSDLKKLKDTSKEVDVLFKSGEVYDTTDTGYIDKFKYYSGEGNGYIYDKKGNVYDVFVDEYSSDSGRIAGGSMNWKCKIAKLDGIHNMIISGYQGIFSSASSKHAGCIVSDIRDGMFLEDYVTKHWSDVDYNSKAIFKEMASAGDPNAKTFSTQKENIASAKVENFYLTYILLPESIAFNITSSGIELRNILQNDAELNKARDKAKYGTESYEQEKEAYNRLATSKTEIVVNGILKPIISKLLGKILQTGSITSYAGIYGNLISTKKPSYRQTFALDTKTNSIVIVNTEKNQVDITNLEFDIDDTIAIRKSDSSPKTLELFKKAADAFKKLNAGKQNKWVEANWATIYHSGYNPYYGKNMTMGQAKAQSKNDYIKYMNSYDFDKMEKLSFSWNLVRGYIVGELETKPIINSHVDPLPEPQKFKNILSKGDIAEASGKMDAWHNGTRKQNITSMSDAKLKMNYEICKDKNYSKEVSILQQEAKRRNILLECYGINECLDIINIL